MSDRGQGFDTPLGLTLPLAGLHFVFFFLVQFDPERAVSLFALDPATALNHPWCFITYQFLHGGLLDLFFGTMVFYYLGISLEAEWGTGEFCVFWLVSTLGAASAAFLLGQALASGTIVVNASMLFAFAYLFPETVFYFFFVIPVKVKWLAYLSLAFLVIRFGATTFSGRPGAAFVEISGATAGFLYFWLRHHGRFRARKAALEAVAAVKEAGAVREDFVLQKRNKELFPRVEALRAATRAGDELPREAKATEADLKRLVVPGVNICKPVDFKGDKDGVCVKCEGFAECSLRYVAGQPEEIVVKKRE